MSRGGIEEIFRTISRLVGNRKALSSEVSDGDGETKATQTEDSGEEIGERINTVRVDDIRLVYESFVANEELFWSQSVFKRVVNRGRSRRIAGAGTDLWGRGNGCRITGTIDAGFQQELDGLGVLRKG